jgi:type IV pilus assembly protein PilO
MAKDTGNEKKKSFDVQEFINTLNTLDPQNIGSWPIAVKLMIYVIVFVVVLVLGYMLSLSALQETLAVGQKQQETLLGEFEGKVFKAQNLETYKRQLKDMEDSFGALLRQLPQDTEVPGLLEDITHTGLGSGVEFDSIDLGAESKQDFYIEQPINIKAHGDYHAFGAFVSGISSLPRIVTLHDFSITPMPGRSDSVDGSPVLSLTVLAKTYRYNDDGSAGDKK